MAKIDDVYEVIKTQAERLEELTAAIIILSKDVKVSTAPRFLEPKPDPRIGQIVAELDELREVVKRTATLPPLPPKEKKSTSDFLIVLREPLNKSLRETVHWTISLPGLFPPVVVKSLST